MLSFSNIETVLAEKLETVLSRGVVNTRMRDFYDIYALTTARACDIDFAILKEAFANTGAKRGSIVLLHDLDLILQEIAESTELVGLWQSYQRKFDYAAYVEWNAVMASVECLALNAMGS